MRISHLLLATLTSLPISAAIAKGGGSTSDYAKDINGRCEVWGPSMLNQRDYALRYTGACKNGRADGKGKVEWLYRYAADMKVKAVWEGEFRNGVFLDGQKIKGNIEPQPGDRYVVGMGSIAGAEVRFISRSPQDGPMELCKVDQVALVLSPKIDPSHDEQVQRAMEDGAKAYFGACPDSHRRVNVGIFTEALKLQPNGRLPNPLASARYDADSGKLSNYTNEAAKKARQARHQAEYSQKQETAHKQFNDFSRKHGIVAWVTVQQLEENPFRWEDKTVGLVVRLDQMVSRDSALVRSGFRDWGPSIQLTGISPDFPDSRRSVLLAAKVAKRERLADGNDKSPLFTTLRHVDSRACESEGCNDWLMWVRGDRELVWGEPYTAR